MLISIDWIKDFVELSKDLSPKELAERFTMGTAEVEGYKQTGEAFSKVKVAQITSIEKHPEADKLNLVTFEYGESKTAQVVCGASNVKVGLKTPYAPLGVTLPCGLTLEPRKIRGILSEGMLCSEEELGFADKSSGIIEYPEDAVVGSNLLSYYGLKTDLIIDVDNKSLTHRPDLWGHYGIAREFATLFNEKMKNPFDKAWEEKLLSKIGQGDSPIKIVMKGDSAGLSYYGLSLEGIEVGETPEYIKTRLDSVGLRSINNIVDISNYVMLELGTPLHIFDRDKISGNEVIIKEIETAEEFITLDEIPRNLISGDTVICDKDKTLVIAGLMGGLESGVTESTKNIFIEVANWKAEKVRKTSTRLGLRTDSSARYEKSLDCQMGKRTLLRTLELILELSPKAKVQGHIEYDGRNLDDIKALTIKTSVANICKTLGIDISSARIMEIFESLGFVIEKKAEDLYLSIPSYRATKDVKVEADLIEEIGRIVGYDNIIPSSPQFDIFPVRRTPARELAHNIRNFMVYNAKSYEVMSYPLIGDKLLRKASWDMPRDLTLINSISKDHNIMRNSLIPSLLEIAATNSKNLSQFKYFELGRTYHPDSKTFSKENSVLGIVFFNKEETPYLEMANTVEELLAATNIPGVITPKNPKFKNNLVSDEWIGAHPFEYQNIRIMGKLDGVMTSIHPLLLKEFKIKGHLTIALIDIENVSQRPLKEKTSYTPLPKFPGANFDWTVVSSNGETAEQILASFKKVKIKELIDVSIQDIFIMNDNEKAITIRAKFLDPNTTLSGDLITKSSEALMEATAKAGLPLRQ